MKSMIKKLLVLYLVLSVSNIIIAMEVIERGNKEIDGNCIRNTEKFIYWINDNKRFVKDVSLRCSFEIKNTYHGILIVKNNRCGFLVLKENRLGDHTGNYREIESIPVNNFTEESFKQFKLNYKNNVKLYNKKYYMFDNKKNHYIIDDISKKSLSHVNYICKDYEGNEKVCHCKYPENEQKAEFRLLLENFLNKL
jgi:hypothetical protein